MEKEEKPLIAVRWAFTNPIAWRGAMELVRWGYKISDRKRHWFWEWIAILPYQNNKGRERVDPRIKRVIEF